MGDYNHGGGLAKPIAIYYEHPDWFRPLFQQLDERGANWLKIEARHHYYDAASPEREYSLLFNRMRSEEHTSELQSHSDLVCRLLLEKKKKQQKKEKHTRNNRRTQADHSR